MMVYMEYWVNSDFPIDRTQYTSKYVLQIGKSLTHMHVADSMSVGL